MTDDPIAHRFNVGVRRHRRLRGRAPAVTAEPVSIAEMPGWKVGSWSRKVGAFRLTVFQGDRSSYWTVRTAGLAPNGMELNGTAPTPEEAAIAAEQVMERLVSGRPGSVLGPDTEEP